jgi:hypothetical protein
VLRLEEALGADGAGAGERLLLAAVLVEQLQRHAGVAGHAVEGVHPETPPLQAAEERFVLTQP